jgi:hypothetical protein
MRLIALAIIFLNSAFCYTQNAEFFVKEELAKFSKTNAGVVLQFDYQVTNTGSDTLRITDYKVACPCTKITFPTVIAPGETAVIHLTFDTKDKYGLQDRSIYLITNTKRKMERLRFKVNVVAVE